MPRRSGAERPRRVKVSTISSRLKSGREARQRPSPTISVTLYTGRLTRRKVRQAFRFPPLTIILEDNHSPVGASAKADSNCNSCSQIRG